MSATDAATTPPAAPSVPKPAAPPVPSALRPAAAVRPAAAGAVAAGQRPAVSRPAVGTPPVTPQAAKPPQSVVPAKPINTWASFFRNWPKAIPMRGVVISRLSESTTFKSFMLQGDLVLLERISPDAVGARFVVLPFDEIATVKYTDQLKQPELESAGFVGNLAK